MTLSFTVNGRAITAQPGQTILDAARAHGIDVPALCHHPDLTPTGGCRLCVVEIEGARNPEPACATGARDGMQVQTDSPALRAHRRALLELLCDGYADARSRADDRPPTEFERECARHGIRLYERVPREGRHEVDADPNPFVWVDLNKCIVCTRCIRACAEIQGRFVWGLGGRGDDTRIVAGADTTMLEGRCESCGACVTYCPTGALDDKRSVRAPAATRRVATTCPYCGVGCRFDLEVRDDRVLRVVPDAAAPVNGLSLCVKGRYGWEFIHHPDRLTTPRVRRYLLDGGAGRERPAERGDWVDVDWDTALDLVAARLVALKQQRGARALGLLASAKCTNEENYLAQKLARQVLGTPHVDHCARLCHASTVAGLGMAFGSGAMTNTMDDVAEHAAAFLVIGSNPTEQHPVFGARLRQAVLRRGARLVVADPRAIDLAELATLHLRHRPGTDVALLNGLMHVVLREGWEDHAFIEARTEDVETVRAVAAAYTPERVAAITGVPAPDIERAAALLARHRPMAVIFAMGITQHTTGVLNVLALANLQMLLGNIGVPGGGVNPLRGQNNVQGACDMGALPNVFPGYQPVTDADAARRFDGAWATDGPGAVAAESGLTVTEMVDRAATGEIAALYVVGENPAVTDPDAGHVRQCLEACQFLVVQEIFPSDTAQLADVVLPGASFAEKDGTFTNTERRVQPVARAVPPPGAARADWAILADLARRILAREGRTPRGAHAAWAYASPGAVLEEVAALTPSYAGVTAARLAAGEALLWPVPSPEHPGTPILHTERFTRGRGRFHATEHLPPAERPDADYPLLLTTGRVLYHWHAAEMTRRVDGLRALYPEALLEVSPEDAARLGIRDRDPVRIISRRGEARARAAVTGRIGPGVVFGTFHFPGAPNINNVTIAALDPVAKIPEYKVCAVAVEPVDEDQAERAAAIADPALSR